MLLLSHQHKEAVYSYARLNTYKVSTAINEPHSSQYIISRGFANKYTKPPIRTLEQVAIFIANNAPN